MSNKILCALSGLEFTVQHMPKSLKLTARESYHPMFDCTYKQLRTLTDSWSRDELEPEESYLLYLALFNSTGLVEFRVPAKVTSLTNSIVAVCMPKLVHIVDKIYHAGIEKSKTILSMPSYVISPDTCDLSNTKYWIANWNTCYSEYLDGYQKQAERNELITIEHALERKIKDATVDISSYAAQLANWASLAGNFAAIDCIVADGFNNDKPIELSKYWKRIIVACAQKKNIFDINKADLNELIEYLENETDVIESGIYGYTLLALLRSVEDVKTKFFNLGDIDVGANGTVYKILDANESVEDANKIVIINSAPLFEPRITDYPNRLAYVKAKLAFEMAQKYKASEELRSNISKDINEAIRKPDDKPDEPFNPNNLEDI